MISRAVSQLCWYKENRYAQPWGELDSFPSLAPDEQRRILAARLLAQIQYFGRRGDALPEWREAARIRDAADLWRIWPDLPVVNKDMLRAQFSPREMRTRFNLQGQVNSTGGSTGEPTSFFHDTAALRAQAGALAYSRRRMGWRPGMATVIVWGSDRDIGKLTPWRVSLRERLLRNYMVPGYELTTATAQRVAALIARHHPVAMYGFSSMLDFVAEQVLRLGLEPPPGHVQTAWNGGEMLFPQQIDNFNRAFGTSILNCYGGRELAVMACQHRAGGPIEVLRPWLFLEVVDREGRPAAPGESGRLLWTSTTCRGTPFLRYDIEDMGAFDAAQCNESGVTALRQLDGRFAGLLELPDGRRFNALFWNHLFKEYMEIRQFQVVLQGSEIELRFRGQGFTEDREADLRRRLGEFLGPMNVRVNWMEKIPLTAQGKLVQVVRQAV